MTEYPKLTITMTDRVPIAITKGKWPILASAKDRETGAWNIFVRMHNDERAIVYGVYTAQSPNEQGQRAGFFLESIYQDNVKLIETIKEVGKLIGAPERLIQQCIANLPAEHIEE